MAKRAVCPELRFSKLPDLGIAGKRIFLLGAQSYRREHNLQRTREQQKKAPSSRPWLVPLNICSRH